ncbi:BA14K family protein (plasmid) [Aliirhizobium terrae]|uniref:BA14K family protein n=1 Tax=Terrirhizobium terrae TaxID=2926709 RepID=UPI0025758455|nr:BA14K family protein [Rhizobium sp. CC-CFT758]WJH37738.1 BA14K family protein [Rhizobium sp. CC-CFT758]
MLCLLKLGFTVAFASFLLAHSFTSAQAFRLIAPSNVPTASKNLAAFEGEIKSGTGSYDLLLSPREIEHIQWCAAQYPSYHPVNDTISDQYGHRTACISPFD